MLRSRADFEFAWIPSKTRLLEKGMRAAACKTQFADARVFVIRDTGDSSVAVAVITKPVIEKLREGAVFE
jgi:hypothetical protein